MTVHWGRKQGRTAEAVPQKEGDFRASAAAAIAVIGFAVCVLFFCTAVHGFSISGDYPAEKSRAAVSAFLSEHTAMADFLGVNEFFAPNSVSVGAFSDRTDEAYRAFLSESAREWSFSDYFRDAWRTLFGLP